MTKKTTSITGKPFFIINCKKIETGDGFLFPIYKDWDPEHKGYEPKMVYATTMQPNTTKGPILHKKRKYYITAISGDVFIEILNQKNELEVISLNEEQSSEYSIVIIESNTPIRLVNKSMTQEAVIINCPSRAWHPEDPDIWKWTSWEEYRNASSK